jgi:osmotically-inducible protein OsmY
MSEQTEQVKAALQHALGAALEAVDVVPDVDDVIRLVGTVRDIEAKRKALHVAIEAAGTRRVKNALHLPGNHDLTDDRIAELLDEALRTDSVFGGIPVDRDRQPQPDQHGNWIGIHTEHGVLRMDGQVPSLSHRRFAEVMAWWTPGVVDVDNRLHVHPPEEENDGEIADVLRLVFDKDQALDAETIKVLVRHAVVTLGGHVASEEQAARAERNCWFVPGVHDVRNELQIVRR